jgi:hypothetical protein
MESPSYTVWTGLAGALTALGAAAMAIEGTRDNPDWGSPLAWFAYVLLAIAAAIFGALILGLIRRRKKPPPQAFDRRIGIRTKGGSLKSTRGKYRRLNTAIDSEDTEAEVNDPDIG